MMFLLLLFNFVAKVFLPLDRLIEVVLDELQFLL
jgi:hypothetical protein